MHRPWTCSDRLLLAPGLCKWIHRAYGKPSARAFTPFHPPHVPADGQWLNNAFHQQHCHWPWLCDSVCPLPNLNYWPHSDIVSQSWLGAQVLIYCSHKLSHLLPSERQSTEICNSNREHYPTLKNSKSIVQVGSSKYFSSCSSVPWWVSCCTHSKSLTAHTPFLAGPARS